MVGDKRRGEVSGTEIGVIQNSAQEPDVRRDAPNAELIERAPGTMNSGVEVPPTARELDQQRIEVPGDLRARGGASVEANTGTTRRPISRDVSGVGAEIVSGVLRGDATLHRGAVERNRVLGQPNFGQRRSRRDLQLRPDNVDIRDFLGDRVLDLHARVHFDEHVVAVFINKEFDGSRAAVVDMPREVHRVGADGLALFGRQARRGRELHNFLVATLHGAVALKEVDDVALSVGEDLHLDVLRVDHRLFEENGGIAEGGFGLIRCGFAQLEEFVAGGDETHTAPATSGNGLDE